MILRVQNVVEDFSVIRNFDLKILKKIEIFDDEQRVFHLRIRVSRQRGFYLREKLTQVVRRDNVF